MPTQPLPAFDAPFGEWAAWYAANGLPIFPCRGKRPIPKHGFYEATCDLEQIARWWQEHPSANIGMPTTGTRFVLDVDPRNGGDATLHELVQKYGPLPDTLRCQTGGGGSHLYFTSPTPVRHHGYIGEGLDVQALGGYVIVPMSVHPDTGKLYQWDIVYGPDDIDPQPAPEWLIARIGPAAKRPPRPSLEVPIIETGHRNGNGRAAAPSIVLPSAAELPLGARIPSGQRNNTLAALAITMARHGATEAAIALALASQNQICDPPLSAEELEQIVRGKVEAYPANPQLIVGAGGQNGTGLVNGTGGPQGQGWGSPSLALTPLSDLLKEPEEDVEWLVDHLLPTGSLSTTVAKPKVGKTTLTRNLALCVAQGKDFLGRTTQQGLVIYLALEEKRSEVRKHFRDMGATGSEEIYIYVASAPADGLQQVRAAAERLKPILIIIDPLFRFTRVKDSNDYAQVTLALEPLLVLARETRAHVLCVHHAGKGNREGGDSILGSTAIFGAVDTALIMRKMEGYRTLQSEQRYGTSLEETVLRYDETTRTVPLGATKEAEDLTRLSQAIGEYLHGQAAPVTEAVIDDAVEGRRGLRKKALRQLVAEGKVTRHGKGGKADPFTYTLADTPPQQDSGSLVPRIVLGTTKPESKNGGIASNDAADCGSQVLPKVEKSREPQNGPGNHNPAPIAVGDLTDLLSADGVQQNPDPYRCASIEQGPDGQRYALFAESQTG